MNSLFLKNKLIHVEGARKGNFLKNAHFFLPKDRASEYASSALQGLPNSFFLQVAAFVSPLAHFLTISDNL